MKTELKDCLHHYLNTGLKIQAKGGMIYTLNFEIYNLTIISGWKPLLLPMSALTEPLEDGTIPIVELCKLAYSKLKYDVTMRADVCFFGTSYDPEQYNFRYFPDEESFYCVSTYRSEAKHVPNQLELFEYLFKNHFNIFDLDESLWIDKRTVKL